MKSVSNSVPVFYTAADVGVLTPPDKLMRFKLTDAELEDKFQTVHGEVTKKQKHYSFEDKKNTPTLIKMAFGAGFLILAWQGIKRALKIFKK